MTIFSEQKKTAQSGGLYSYIRQRNYFFASAAAAAAAAAAA